ncbi:MAG: hypothetical protein MI757_22370 [Pirellulales bacterium]|nr:hypothetical protein [Pirellulales bacterium]
MLNRAAVTLTAKQPMVDWINAVDGDPNSKPTTLDEANREYQVYLIDGEYADDFEP